MAGVGKLGAGLALVALTAAVYAPVVKSGWIWDDTFFVTLNPLMGSLDGLRRIWTDVGATNLYYPVTFTSLWLDFRFFGLEPAGYHAVNIALHALVALLLWRLLAFLALPGAWLAAAVFALHPVHVESVAWVSERKNVLSGALYLTAALLYLRFALGPPGRRGLYAAALAVFALSLLAKAVTCTLPAALLLVLWWKRGRVTRADVLATLPFFALGLIHGLATAQMERSITGAAGPDWDFSPVERGLIAGRALWFYAAKLAWPVDLTFVYPRWRIDPGAAWQYLYPASALAVVAALWAARGRIGRGPLAAVLFFAGSLFPALGFVDVFPMTFTFVADHYQYLASIGLIALAISSATGLVRKWPFATRPVRSAAAAALLLALGLPTLAHGRVFRDRETLWLDTLRKNPDCWLAHTWIGVEYRRQERHAEAERHLERAIALKPDLLEAHAALGDLRLAQRDFAGAEAAFRRGLAVDAEAAEFHYYLGVVRARSQRPAEAEPWLRRAIALAPADARYHLELGRVLYRQGRLGPAREALERAAELAPDDERVRRLLAKLRGG